MDNDRSFGIKTATTDSVGVIKPSTGLSVDTDRTLTVKYGSVAGTACQGNDGRLAADYGFTQSLTTNGWQKLPGGLIIQWGRCAPPATGQTATIAFPVAFTTACFTVNIHNAIPKTSANYDVEAQLLTFPATTTFTIYLQALNDNTSYPVEQLCWIAVGY